MSAVTSEEKMANPYEAWGELFVSDVIAQPGRHKVEAEGELHKRLSLFASYCMENATTAGDALLVNDLIDAARLVRLDKEAAIAKALADRPDLPGVPDGWLSFLDPLEAAAREATPGPWYFDRDWSRIPTIYAGNDWYDRRGYVAYVEKDRDERDGNARLIQAANPSTILSLRPQIEAAIEAKVAEAIAPYVEALTASGETKGAYIGEFLFNARVYDNDADYRELPFIVPWPTIKEIMAKILSRARSSHMEKQP